MINESITDEQISGLAREAADAGDTLQQAICGIALKSDDTAECLRVLGEFGPGAGEDSVAWARTECARVIAEASAMID